MRFTLRVIPEPDPETNTILIQPEGSDTTVFIRGTNTGFVYTCGGCDAPLLLDIPPKQVTRMALKCAACGAFNEAGVVPGHN